MDPNENNPYDFIFKDNTPPPQQTGLGSKSKQILIFGVFVAIILTIVIIVVSVIASSNKPTATEAISANAYQNEIVRILELSDGNITSSGLQQKAKTIGLVLTDDQKRVASAISARGITATEAQLTQYLKTSRDTELTNSLQVDRYDMVFEEMVDELFQKYYSALVSAEKVAKTTKEKQLLEKARINAEVIYAAQNQSTTDDASFKSSEEIHSNTQ